MTSPSRLPVVVLPDERAVARAVASRVEAVLIARPDAVLGLPTGRTPIALYAELRSRSGLSFAHASTFNLDEFLGLPPSHPASYRQFMAQHLFAHVDLDPARVGFLRGDAPDPERECGRYEAAIAAAGGIDLQVLGIGTNGHIGFNEPGPSLEARTHRVVLREETRRSNAGFFGGSIEAVPREALSMGMATILQARAVVLIATGRRKAGCVAQLVRGPITTELPASFLQMHPAAEIVLDEEAASGLTDAERGAAGSAD
jgi:glucosamine-6-phosphate deaminase